MPQSWWDRANDGSEDGEGGVGDGKRSRCVPPHPLRIKHYTLTASRAAPGHSWTIHVLLLGSTMCYPCAKALDSTDVCNTFYVSLNLSPAGKAMSAKVACPLTFK